MVTKFDHPDFVGGIVWSDCELRWINEKLAAAQAREAELVAHVERLREVIKDEWEYHKDNYDEPNYELKKALDATPAQSLARYHNEALEKAEKARCARSVPPG